MKQFSYVIKDELGIQPAEEEDLLLEKRYDRA